MLEATPKEAAAWATFQALIEATGSSQGNIAPIVQSELDRLCAKKNPLALCLKEHLSIAADRPRLQSEAPKAPPEARRVRHIQWVHGGQSKPSNDS